MDMVRTTVSIPKDFHEELKLIAFRENKSLGEVLVEKVKGKRVVGCEKSVEQQIKEDFALFDKIAKSGVQNLNAVKVVREERERDNV